MWTSVRDDRLAAATARSAVWFAYSSNRRGEHPPRHLASSSASSKTMPLPDSTRFIPRG
ncbi:MAG: hypothetical protein KIT40_03210 [Nitrospira sp.]|nr:hypothetical protein [Nitrospira sp.]